MMWPVWCDDRDGHLGVIACECNVICCVVAAAVRGLSDHCSPLTVACHGEFDPVWAHCWIHTNELVVYAQHQVLETYRTRKETRVLHRPDNMHACVAMVSNYFISILAPRNKRLQTQTHSYVVLHRSGGLAICGGIKGSTPMIGILWRKPLWSDLPWTFVRRRHRPNCSTSHRAADLCVSIQLSSSCTWDILRVLMNEVLFDTSFGDWRKL